MGTQNSQIGRRGRRKEPSKQTRLCGGVWIASWTCVTEQGSEWLVTDQRGAFAMGTPEGVRTRKYHGFYMGLPGRSQTAYLVDLDLECDGVSLWSQRSPSCEWSEGGPAWRWVLPHGVMKFAVAPAVAGGISLFWSWLAQSRKIAKLRVRGFWAMRDLHQLGGNPWSFELNPSQEGGSSRFSIRAENTASQCQGLLKGNWKWIADPQWKKEVFYPEEKARGYPDKEDLFSEGVLETHLQPNETREWILSEKAEVLTQNNTFQKKARPRLFDFVLMEPAGIAAGFPWFGEWGRDTFVSLPGIVAAALSLKNSPQEVWGWASPILHRWGAWIQQDGMLPNVLENGGKPQWESADATLWWCHSLVALWMFSLCVPFPQGEPQKHFSTVLDRAVSAIQAGQHRALRLLSTGLIEVTEPHSTWMDARVNGAAVTPRLGILPEINALWFQARCLQWLWSGQGTYKELEELGVRILEDCSEPERSNTVFLHSLPLSPSFVLSDWRRLEEDLLEMGQRFWTPVGLRTLDPENPEYQRSYEGSQTQRDLSYHRGPVWAWLGGHYEMARQRWALRTGGRVPGSKVPDQMFPTARLVEMPIRGHIPELFDPEPPFQSRGTPAQAWSLACLEEAKGRTLFRVDTQLRKAIQNRKQAMASIRAERSSGSELSESGGPK